VSIPTDAEVADYWFRRCQAEKAALAASEAQVAELRAALQWYADENNYGCTPWSEGLDGGPRIDQDWGERARAVLSRQPAGAGE